MKPNHARRTTGGFSGWDALVVVVTVGLFVTVMPALLTRPKVNSSRIGCVNNLKQIGLAYRMWSNDNGERFPWAVMPSSTNTGTLPLLTSTNVWRHFQIISNEINTPKVFVCRADSGRTWSDTWDSFTNNSRLSYFLGMDADETKPQTILSGDRNLAISNKLLTGFVRLATNAALGWTKEIHQGMGNVGLGDGSVQQMNGQTIIKQYEYAASSHTQSVLQFSFPQ